MSKLKKVLLPLKKTRNKFILHLNKSLYKDELVKQAVLEDRDWVKEAASSSSGYVCLELKTPDTRDVLNWVNYLIYLHKG